MAENNLFKGFTTIGFEIMTEISPASLTEIVDGAADLPAKNLPQREESHATPLLSLSDYFWS